MFFLIIYRSSSRTEPSPAAKKRKIKQEVYTAELIESQEEAEPKQEVEMEPDENSSSSSVCQWVISLLWGIFLLSDHNCDECMSGKIPLCL